MFEHVPALRVSAPDRRIRKPCNENDVCGQAGGEQPCGYAIMQLVGKFDTIEPMERRGTGMFTALEHPFALAESGSDVFLQVTKTAGWVGDRGGLSECARAVVVGQYLVGVGQLGERRVANLENDIVKCELSRACRQVRSIDHNLDVDVGAGWQRCFVCHVGC